ncbi:MAG: hypothetical protein F6K39_26410 [Okeania sp. SIO3B3]|nr:hypothetical protein [Okeania sp. SIO3B3]
MKIALIGDYHATYDSFKKNANIKNWGCSGLPIWDIELKIKFEEIILGDFQRIYFSCSHPFTGCEKVKDIVDLSNNNFFEFTQKQRGFFGQKKHEKISKEQAEKLYSKYIEYLIFFVSMDSRITLLPIVIIWHEKIRKTKGMPPIYNDLKRLPMLDIKPLLARFDFVDKFGRLHPEAVNKIIALL